MAGFSAPFAPTRNSFMTKSPRECVATDSRAKPAESRPDRAESVRMGSGGADDALLEQHVAIEAALAGLDDGEGALDPLVEGEALEQSELHVRLVLLDDAVEILVRLLALFGAPHHF